MMIADNVTNAARLATVAAAANTERMDTCLDASDMLRRLTALMPVCRSGRMTIDALRIAKVRRNTSIQRNPHPMTVLYELELREVATQALSMQRLYAKLYRDGKSAAVDTAALGKRSPGPSLHLPELDLRLWPWPADPGLPQIPGLLNKAQTQAWWGEDAHSIELLRYEPESRATLRYSRSSAVGREDLYAKTFADHRGEAVQRRFQHFWDRAQRDAHAFTVARPLAYDVRTHSVWQASAEGTPLVNCLAAAHRDQDIQQLDQIATLIADALAALHSAPLSLAGPLRRDVSHWITELSRRSRKIARVAPALADRVASLTHVLQQQSAGFAARPSSLIHGDFHPEQLWVQMQHRSTPQRLVLFDFDEFSLGDPMEDLAEFSTQLAVLEGGQAFGLRLRRAVALRSPERFNDQRLDWHLSVQQILQACRAFAFQRPDWQAQIEQRLLKAEALTQIGSCP